MAADSGISALPRVLSALRVAPLWMYIALALAGYAALVAPPFGGVDLTEFRKNWGWLCWFGAIACTIFSLIKVIDSAVNAAVKKRKTRAGIREQYDKKRYEKIYAPLYSDLIKLHVTMSKGYMLLRQGDRPGEGELRRDGKVGHGGEFPLEKIEHVVTLNSSFCDPELITLVRRAVNTRMESETRPEELTSEDCLICDHIKQEYGRLKQMLTTYETDT